MEGRRLGLEEVAGWACCVCWILRAALPCVLRGLLVVAGTVTVLRYHSAVMAGCRGRGAGVWVARHGRVKSAGQAILAPVLKACVRTVHVTDSNSRSRLTISRWGNPYRAI